MHRAAVIFEGGAAPETDLQETIRGLRHAVTLDTLEKYIGAGLDEVILATNQPSLATAAHAMGARIWDTRQVQPFHFGKTLQRLVSELDAEGILYCSGAGLPLITSGEIQWILETMEQHPPCVVVNNLQSVDLVAWNPADYIQRITAPDSDNFLGVLLKEVGMEKIVIPNSAAIHFDLDTPTDFLILGLSGQAGLRAQAALKALTWPKEALIRAADVLTTDLPEVALIGRVGTPIIDHFNKNLRIRLRVMSEERGMKALRREEEGKVRSLVGDMIDQIGPRQFFQQLESVCSAVFFDTRVVFANRGRRVSEWDRFHSDLGRVDLIRDPWVREFTEAALACRIPVVLGGHSVVSGGLWILADRAIRCLSDLNVLKYRGYGPR